jgi:hypothetical protein
VPLKVDENDYAVSIEIEGEDENGVTHTVTKDYYLEVKKDKHLLKILNAIVAPSAVSCERRATASIDVLNLGSEDEDEAKVEISGPGLSFSEGDLEINSGTDDDAEYSKSITFTVADNVAAGTYDVVFTTYYDNKKSDSKTLQLAVKNCVEETVVPQTPTEPVEQPIEPTEPSEPVIITPEPVTPVSNQMLVTGLVAGGVIIAGLIIFLIVVMIVKMRK